MSLTGVIVLGLIVWYAAGAVVLRRTPAGEFSGSPEKDDLIRILVWAFTPLWLPFLAFTNIALFLTKPRG